MQIQDDMLAIIGDTVTHKWIVEEMGQLDWWLIFEGGTVNHRRKTG
jgi:hypothetical protein